MSDFAKIIVVDGEQVLFYTEPDPEDETKTKLHQIAQPDGLVADVALGGIKDDTGLLDRIGDAEARSVLQIIRQFVDDGAA